jgi:TPP-dependent pyruvate/acetoin dehydrogenase alpha subunit
MFSFQLVGTGMPVAAGVAWASRYVLKEDKVTALFIGDAASSNAQFLEGLNAAALRKVPLLIVVEDNKLAGNITPEYYFPGGTKVEDRLAAFGIKSARIDGNKLDEVIHYAETAIDRIRTSSEPLGLVCDTTRLLMHKIGQGDARTPEQLAELAKRDPISYVETNLLHLTKEQKDEIASDAAARVSLAITRAHAAPWPKPD